MKKILLIIGSVLAGILLILSIIILSASDLEYVLTKEYEAPPIHVSAVMLNMKYWPEWKKGVKATRILQADDQGVLYEVVRLDDDIEIRDTVYVRKYSPHKISFEERNEFYKLTKNYEIETLKDSSSRLTVHYYYNADGQIKRFLLKTISSYLHSDAEMELNKLTEVIDNKTE